MSVPGNSTTLEEPNYDSHQITLLTKYRIPIQHFEFDYIEKCNDGKELEKILLVLQSGEEGHYPDLENAVEERLIKVKPKSKLLRKVTQVLSKNDLEQNELETILGDLNIWVKEVSKDDRELESRKTSKRQQDVPVRKPTTNYISDENQKDQKEKRISSIDFKAWDKYDPDTELLKMELEEKKTQETQKSIISKSKQKSVFINDFGTEAEKNFFSNREREKGNEYFKNGEYEEALLCYDNSIRLKKNVDNLNNRAMTHIKLQNYSKAIKDCKDVLYLDQDNLKAHWRIAEALEKENKFEDALEHIEFVIAEDPNNGHAQQLAENIQKNCVRGRKTIQMQITEAE